MVQPTTKYTRDNIARNVSLLHRSIIRDLSKLQFQEGHDALFNCLNELRIAKTNLVYIIGISPRLAEESVLADLDFKKC